MGKLRKGTTLNIGLNGHGLKNNIPFNISPKIMQTKTRDCTSIPYIVL